MSADLKIVRLAPTGGMVVFRTTRWRSQETALAGLIGDHAEHAETRPTESLTPPGLVGVVAPVLRLVPLAIIAPFSRRSAHLYSRR